MGRGGGAIIKPIFSASSPPSLQNAFLPPLPDFSPLLLPSSFGLSLSFLLLPSNPHVSCLAMKQKAEEEVTSWCRFEFANYTWMCSIMATHPSHANLPQAKPLTLRNPRSPSGFASQKRGEEPTRENFSLSAANEFSLEGGGERGRMRIMQEVGLGWAGFF